MKQIKVKQGEETKAVIEHYGDGKVFIFEGGFGRFVTEVDANSYGSTSNKRYAGVLSNHDVENVALQLVSKLGNTNVELLESVK